MDCLSWQNSSLIGPTNPAKFENDCISRSVHRFKITQPNLTILVSFSSAEDVLSNDVKNMTFLLKIRHSAFFGTRSIVVADKCYQKYWIKEPPNFPTFHLIKKPFSVQQWATRARSLQFRKRTIFNFFFSSFFSSSFSSWCSVTKKDI